MIDTVTTRVHSDWHPLPMGNDESPSELEFTWNRGFDGVYENAGKDVHIPFRVADYDGAHKLHEEMGCIIRENKAMGL